MRALGYDLGRAVTDKARCILTTPITTPTSSPLHPLCCRFLPENPALDNNTKKAAVAAKREAAAVAAVNFGTVRRAGPAYYHLGDGWPADADDDADEWAAGAAVSVAAKYVDARRAAIAAAAGAENTDDARAADAAAAAENTDDVRAADTAGAAKKEANAAAANAAGWR